MGRLELPISDFLTDTKTALDNSLRVLQALTGASADAGYLTTALNCTSLVQSLMQVDPIWDNVIQYYIIIFRIMSTTLQAWHDHWVISHKGKAHAHSTSIHCSLWRMQPCSSPEFCSNHTRACEFYSEQASGPHITWSQDTLLLQSYLYSTRFWSSCERHPVICLHQEYWDRLVARHRKMLHVVLIPDRLLTFEEITSSRMQNLVCSLVHSLVSRVQVQYF